LPLSFKGYVILEYTGMNSLISYPFLIETDCSILMINIFTVKNDIKILFGERVNQWNLKL